MKKKTLYDLKWNRFHYTNSYISEPFNGRIYFKSYDTIVGYEITRNGKKFLIIGWDTYSPTTTRQIDRWLNSNVKEIRQMIKQESIGLIDYNIMMLDLQRTYERLNNK